MTLEQAIIIIEDGAARTELCNRWIPGKNKEARARQAEAQKTRRDIIEHLKRLVNEDFEEIDKRQQPYGDWWKLEEKKVW